MTFIHILNFAIPITCMVLLGVGLDKMCKPEVQDQDGKN